jgi:hypothetical protein
MKFLKESTVIIPQNEIFLVFHKDRKQTQKKTKCKIPTESSSCHL